MKLTSASILLGAIPTLVGAACSVPDVVTLRNISKLPDPFLFANGGPRVTNLAEWECRRAEINSLIQQFELGTLPPRPSEFNSSLEAGTLTINAGEAGNSITFTASITYPSTGTGPFPAMIVYDGVSIPIPDGVAVIILQIDPIAQQIDHTSRGVGLFYELYGTNATASAMMAWTWAVSRVIDALEVAPNTGNINLQRLGVTGCSRNGKGALVAGAFEERIRLTIPQESGSGGDACWRLSDFEQSEGNMVQTLGEIVGENVWFSLSLNQFVNHTDLLPFDHHTLAGLIAPRALIAFENTAFEWLSPWSSDGCMITAHKVWEALGVPDNMGFSQDGNHSHCAFPDDQLPELMAYFNQFLLDIPANTSVMKSPETFNESQWIDWTVPHLA